MGLKDPLSSIPFIIWQSPQDHQILLFFCAHKEKAFSGIQGGFFIVQFPMVREREHYTPLVPCLSQSHIRSDHWWIKALPDTSFPLSEES